MEKSPSNDTPAELVQYANDLYSAVDFLFAKRYVRSETGGDLVNRYCELQLNDDEIKDIESAFTDNFIDPPTSVEIILFGLNPNLYRDADSGGALIITQRDDGESTYATQYGVWFNGTGPQSTYACKDVHRKTKPVEPQYGQGILPGLDSLSEIIFKDTPLDASERAALNAMIAKL